MFNNIYDYIFIIFAYIYNQIWIEVASYLWETLNWELKFLIKVFDLLLIIYDTSDQLVYLSSFQFPHIQ